MTIGLILTLIFLVLKLTGYLHWEWWIVFLPVIVEFIVSMSWRGSPYWWRGPPPP
jgi:Transmembrane Fragile-X-F protein